MKITIGGNRLGSGKKMQTSLHNYGRSTHNLSRIWKSTSGPGTLDPFMVELGLPGDTFDINLKSLVRTTPTAGPIFGSFKMQMDVFMVPIRLYIAELHNAKIGIGMKMSQVKLPKMRLVGPNPTASGGELNSQQIDPSSLLHKLGVTGLGKGGLNGVVTREMQALPLLMYWDIYKNYYANKQEGIGVVIDEEGNAGNEAEITRADYSDEGSSSSYQMSSEMYRPTTDTQIYGLGPYANIIVQGYNLTPAAHVYIRHSAVGDTNNVTVSDVPKIEDATNDDEFMYQWQPNGMMIVIKKNPNFPNRYRDRTMVSNTDAPGIEIMRNDGVSGVEGVSTFDLNILDGMREELLRQIPATDVIINDLGTGSGNPYKATYGTITGQNNLMNASRPLAGLGVKTYLSDRFNNWIETEWIDGPNGVTAISAVDTSSGSFSMDSLNLAQKIYNLLNRIAASGGTYQDWISAVWGDENKWTAETPIYMGGASSEIAFEEVVSTADSTAADGQSAPLGTLAGHGKEMNGKGGSVRVKVQEPCFIMGILSFTPRLDYSQGNKWYTRLETMDDLHKPELDGIGFQELITDEMAAWDTVIGEDGTPTYKSAGKQPAFIEYMTSQNEIHGQFATGQILDSMVMNREYKADSDGNIADLTTYIDPSQFNYLFALRNNQEMPFWVQIGIDCYKRSKMSAKLIPNL